MAQGNPSGGLRSRLRRALSRQVLTPVVLAATVTAGWVYAVAPPVIEAQAPVAPPAARPADSTPVEAASVTTITEVPPVALVPSAPVVVGTATSRPVALTPTLAAILLEAYRNAVAGAPEACHLPVSLLAAIGEVESGSLAGRPVDAEHRSHVLGPVLDGDPFGRVPDTDGGLLDDNAVWDRALGPMQILPGTWVRFATDGDHDGRLDPQDLDDAAATAASYLCAGGRDLSRPEDLRAAVLAYNHSTAYLRLVMTLVVRYEAAGLDQTLPADVAVATAALQLSATPVPTDASHVRGYLVTGLGQPSGSPSVVAASAAPTPAEQVVAALGEPTGSPAVTPSPAPTPSASTAPTPSTSPGVPRPEPTPSPSPAPGTGSTSSPTAEPSGSTTGEPPGGATGGTTSSPTDSPSAGTTSTPADSPSAGATEGATSSPTDEPSGGTNGGTTDGPADGPSAGTTSSPTDDPTVTPTATPTGASADPSPSPTCGTEPAPSPTGEPGPTGAASPTGETAPACPVSTPSAHQEAP